LEPGRTPKTDKVAIINDAIRMVNQARDEAQKLKDLNSSLQEKIKELKVKTENSCKIFSLSIDLMYMPICRMRRTSCVMRNRSLRSRRRESISNWKLLRHSLSLNLVSYQIRKHSLKLKLLEASLSLSQLIPALQCGNSCLLLLLIPHRTMSFVLQLL